MSVVQYLRDTRLFDENPPQGNGTVSFELKDWRYATVYVPKNDRVFHITLSALCQERFPNNERLLKFANCHTTRVVHGRASNKAYELEGRHVADVVTLVREGLGA